MRGPDWVSQSDSTLVVKDMTHHGRGTNTLGGLYWLWFLQREKDVVQDETLTTRNDNEDNDEDNK